MTGVVSRGATGAASAKCTTSGRSPVAVDIDERVEDPSTRADCIDDELAARRRCIEHNETVIGVNSTECENASTIAAAHDFRVRA